MRQSMYGAIHHQAESGIPTFYEETRYANIIVSSLLYHLDRIVFHEVYGDRVLTPYRGGAVIFLHLSRLQTDSGPEDPDKSGTLVVPDYLIRRTENGERRKGRGETRSENLALQVRIAWRDCLSV